MLKKLFGFGLTLSLIFSSIPSASAVADVVTNSSAWSRNNVNNTDISTSGLAINTRFALASNNDKVEIATMVRNTGNAVSGTIELWRTGDPAGTYVNNTFKKYQGGVWTDLHANWTAFNTQGSKLNLGTIAPGAYIRVVYQIDVGGGHTYGDVLQDYIKIYETTVLVKTLSVSTYVPYLKIQSASSGNNSIVVNSAIALLQSSAETIGNFEVSKDNGGTFTTLSGPSTAVYDNVARTITLTQSQVDFDAGDNIIVRTANLKTADNLRFLNPPNFTTVGSKVSTAVASAVDTTSPTFTVGFDAIAGPYGTLFLTFNEAMNTSTLTTANALARTAFNNGHDLGTSPTVSWTSTSTAKITLDSNGDVIAGDTLTLDNNITDANGNAVNGSAIAITTIVLDSPVITSFAIADQSSASTLFTNSRTINITSFTATDADGIVQGYLANENAGTPTLVSINHNPAPTTYTITGAEGASTIYAWVKDDDDHITGTSAGITLDLTNPVVIADVASGTYSSAQTVTLSFSTETNPDKIYYTLDGSVPDNTDTQYTAPLSVNSDLTLNFIGYDLAGNLSSVGTRTYAFACNPSSVANGLVASYPICTITCNAGYVLSGTSCNAQSSSSSGGGGGGGGSVDTTTVYKLPTLSSDKVVKTYRPIKVSGDTFTRPVSLVNYYTDATAEIPAETKVTDFNGEPLEDVVLYPIDRIKADEAKMNFRIPYPEQDLAYSRYYQFGNLVEKFSQDIQLSIPVTSSVLKLDLEKINIYQWIPAEPPALVDKDGFVYRAGKWELMGKGKLINQDGLLEFATNHSTLIAFTSQSIISTSDDDDTTEPTENDENDLQTPVDTGVTPFQDILGHWAKEFIEKLYEKGIVSGKTKDSFAPNDNLTRAELTKIALKSFGFEVPESVSEKPFSDVAIEAWYAVFIAKAKESGVLSGYADGTFRPNQPINRAEALKILIEASGIETAGYEATFLDTDANAWYAPYIAYAKQKGIVEGYSAEVTVAKVLDNSRLIEVTNLYGFGRYLEFDDVGSDVLQLQKVLVLLGFVDLNLNGQFDAKTLQALTQYQLNRGLIEDKSDFGAGYFGPLTYARFIAEKVQTDVEFTTEIQYYFKPEQFITRAEIAKIAIKLIEEN